MTLEFQSDDMIRVYASLFEQGESFLPFDMPHYSYFFKKVLALGFVDAAHSEPGTEVEILWGNVGERQTTIRATVQPSPYKSDNRRADLGDYVAPAVRV